MINRQSMDNVRGEWVIRADAGISGESTDGRVRLDGRATWVSSRLINNCAQSLFWIPGEVPS
jgi:hypothetical protein